MYLDINYAFKCVSHDGSLLRFFPPEIKNNPLVVLEAIKQDVCSLEYASKELRSSREIIIAAFDYCPKEASCFVDISEMLEDRVFMLKWLPVVPNIIFRERKLANIPFEYAHLVVSRERNTLCLLDHYFRCNRNIVKEAIKCCHEAIIDMSPQLSGDLELCTLAIANYRNDQYSYYTHDLFMNHVESSIPSILDGYFGMMIKPSIKALHILSYPKLRSRITSNLYFLNRHGIDFGIILKRKIAGFLCFDRMSCDPDWNTDLGKDQDEQLVLKGSKWKLPGDITPAIIKKARLNIICHLD